jgi:hypothetical protein
VTDCSAGVTLIESVREYGLPAEIGWPSGEGGGRMFCAMA